MKFTLIALAGALTAANGRQLRNTTPRKLENENNNYNYQPQMTSSSTLTFERCIDVTTMADEDEDIQAAISAGYAKAESSYVTVFPNNYANEKERMIMTVGSYVAAKVKASANKDRQFCDACKDWQETCYAQQYGYNNADAEYAEDEQQDQAEDGAEENQQQNQAEEGDEAAEGDEAGRKLYNAPDCDVCAAKNCFAEEQEGAVDYDEMVGQFVEQVAECMEVEDANGNAYYIGMACSSYGDAAEFAVFMDDGCTVMTNTKSASSVLSSAYSDEGMSYSTLMSMTSTYLQEAFTTDSSCYQMQYDKPDEDGNNNNNQNQEEEIAEVCRDITEDAMYVAYCYVDQQEQQEAAEDEQQAWYDVDVQNADDLEEVCSVVNAKLNMDGETQWTYFYDEEKQGSAYERNKKGQLVGSAADQASMGGGMIFLITALVIAIVVAPIAWLINSKKNTTASESDYQGGTLS
jgi:hypothetical protein